MLEQVQGVPRVLIHLACQVSSTWPCHGWDLPCWLPATISKTRASCVQQCERTVTAKETYLVMSGCFNWKINQYNLPYWQFKEEKTQRYQSVEKERIWQSSASIHDKPRIKDWTRMEGTPTSWYTYKDLQRTPLSTAGDQERPQDQEQGRHSNTSLNVFTAGAPKTRGEADTPTPAWTSSPQAPPRPGVRQTPQHQPERLHRRRPQDQERGRHPNTSLNVFTTGAPLREDTKPVQALHESRSVTSDSFVAPQTGPPGSSVQGILQARTLEWVAVPFSRGSSLPRDRTWVSRIAGRFFWATKEAQIIYRQQNLCSKTPRNQPKINTKNPHRTEKWIW